MYNGRDSDYPDKHDHLENVYIPKSTHICNTPMAVYINNTYYIPNNLRVEIRNHCEFQEAARFLKGKHN